MITSGEQRFMPTLPQFASDRTQVLGLRWIVDIEPEDAHTESDSARNRLAIPANIHAVDQRMKCV